jgi:hypothetical protein
LRFYVLSAPPFEAATVTTAKDRIRHGGKKYAVGF